MAAAIVQGYGLGLLIEKLRLKQRGKTAKALLILSVCISLGILGYFKYANFFIDNFNAVTGLDIRLLQIALPIGISFYTFQLLSYSVDIYRGDATAQRNIVSFAAYISMFPQLIAGPIVRYSDIAPQLNDRTHSLEDIALGLRRFVIGLAKKVLIANVLGELTEVGRTTASRTVLMVWLYAVSYTLHLYYDFSGYSDMAIGLGRIFGFRFPENFNYPYISTSITEFWRRWHMSLGTWFRDYLYIPLGGNKVPKWRWLLNILAVWLATGLWHGASWNFVFWGLWFAVLLMAEKMFLLKFLKKSKVLSRIYVLFFILLSFVIFDHTDLSEACIKIGQMIGAGNIPAVNAESLYMLRSYGFIILIAAIGSTPIPKMLVQKISTAPRGKVTLNIIEPLYLVSMLAIITAFLVDGSFNPFLYFRF